MTKQEIKQFRRDLLKRKVRRYARMFGDTASKTLIAGMGVVGMGAIFTIAGVFKN